MTNVKLYSRTWDGKTLFAHVLSINPAKVVYYFNSPKKKIVEYTPLFLKVFCPVS